MQTNCMKDARSLSLSMNLRAGRTAGRRGAWGAVAPGRQPVSRSILRPEVEALRVGHSLTVPSVPPQPAVAQACPLSRQRVLLADFAQALRQQMFFWGRDVVCGGNLLLRHGFEKRPSPGLKGTSCYRLAYGGGVIELHGACAGWYPAVGSAAPGVLFVRTTGRCTAHRMHEPVVPGQRVEKGPEHTTQAARAGPQMFAAWLAGYERWVRQEMGAAYRQRCQAMLTALPKGKPWLPPEQAEAWLQRFATQGALTPRAKAFEG